MQKRILAEMKHVCALKFCKHTIISFFLIMISLRLISVAVADVGGYAQTGIDRFNHTYERAITGDPAKDIVTIALAQQEKKGAELGYTGDWCAAFVTDCAKYAGVGDLMPFVSGCTHACGGFINSNAKGLYEYMLLAGATEIGQGHKQADKSWVFYGEAKAGDIVFFHETGADSYGHVGIVTGNNSTIEGNLWAQNSTSYRNSIVSTHAIVNRGGQRDYDYVTVLRPSYPAGGKPQTPVINTDRDVYVVGNTVTITLANTEGSASQYMQFKHIESNEYIYNDYTIGTYTHRFTLTTPGTYQINYQIGNNYGNSDVVSKQIIVIEKMPIPTITLDRNEYREGDTVVITLGNAAYSDSQYMQIQNSQTQEFLYNQSTTGTYRHEITVPQQGTYTIAYQVAQQNIQSEVAYKSFTVLEKAAAPSMPAIITSRDIYVAGETMVISLSDLSVSTSQYMQFQNLDTGAYLYNKDSTGVYQHSFVLCQAGRYGISFQTANENGQSPVAYKGIRVIEEMMDPSIVTDKDVYAAGETVCITLQNTESSDSQYMQVKNMETGEFLFNGSTTGQFAYELIINEAGTYVILYQTACQLGQSEVARKQIVIQDKHIHTEAIDVAVPATHVTTGLTEGVHCSECGEVLIQQEMIPVVKVSKKIKLPALLKAIEKEAFVNNSFVCVIIPEGCIKISSSAFKNCSRLQFVEIPSSVQSIAEDAFEDCSDSLIIVTTRDSIAESYAQSQGITCVVH